MSDLDLKVVKRPNGIVQIVWDPNSGALQINVTGLTQIEEMGKMLYAFVKHLRLNATGVGLEKSAIYKPGAPS